MFSLSQDRWPWIKKWISGPEGWIREEREAGLLGVSIWDGQRSEMPVCWGDARRIDSRAKEGETKTALLHTDTVMHFKSVVICIYVHVTFLLYICLNQSFDPHSASCGCIAVGSTEDTWILVQSSVTWLVWHRVQPDPLSVFFPHFVGSCVKYDVSEML